jgi:hypothetical protein
MSTVSLCLSLQLTAGERHCVTDGWTTSWPGTRLMPDASPLPSTSVGCDVMRGSLGQPDGSTTRLALTTISVLPTLVQIFTAPVGEFGRSHSCATSYALPFPLCVHLGRAGHTVSSLLSDLETRLWPAQACSSLWSNREVQQASGDETSISLAFSTAMTKRWLLRGRDGGLRYLQERLQTAENCPMFVCEG